MDYQRFYKHLFKPIVERIGPIDEATMVALIGFDCGGPLNFCTVGRGSEQFITYVSCELAVREDQRVGETGPFELMMTCDDQKFVRKVVTKIGQMSLEEVFEHGHTIDIAPIVGADCPVRGLVVEEFARVTIDGRGYGILLLLGVTRTELKFAMKSGTDELLTLLKQEGVYPRTSIHRSKSIKLGAKPKLAKMP